MLLLKLCSPQIGAIYNPHCPYPTDSLWAKKKWGRDRMVVSSKRLLFTIIFKFLKHCKKIHTCLPKGGEGCKLTMMPGLLIPWKDQGTIAISFFSGSLPHTWLIPKSGGGCSFYPTNDATPCIVLRPVTSPLLDPPSHIQTVWHSPDNHMAVAYITDEGILYLLLQPQWIIINTGVGWKPWKGEKKIVNALPPSPPSYLLGTSYVVVVASDNAIAIFNNNNDLDDEKLPPYPLHNLAQISLMWYVPIRGLINDKKKKMR